MVSYLYSIGNIAVEHPHPADLAVVGDTHAAHGVVRRGRYLQTDR